MGAGAVGVRRRGFEGGAGRGADEAGEQPVGDGAGHRLDRDAADERAKRVEEGGIVAAQSRRAAEIGAEVLADALMSDLGID